MSADGPNRPASDRSPGSASASEDSTPKISPDSGPSGSEPSATPATAGGSTGTTAVSDEPPEVFPEAALRNRTLAAVLSWLIPGLGQIYQGRTGKGVLFMVCVLGTFTFGLFLSRGHAVHLDFNSPSWYEWRLHYFAQALVGGPSLPAVGQYALVRWGFDPITEFEAPPARAANGWSGRRTPDTLSEWHGRNDMDFDMGTIYTMLAGLLNVFVILDAYAGPLPPLRVRSDDESQES